MMLTCRIRDLKRVAGVFLIFFFVSFGAFDGYACASETKGGEPSKLLILWASGDKDVAYMVALAYPKVAKQSGWWDQVRIIIWGPSAKLLAEDPAMLPLIKALQKEGVEILACKWCADQYGVGKKLEEMGVKVDFMGEPLTKMLKSDWKILTF
jgi:hypothetical protein